MKKNNKKIANKKTNNKKIFKKSNKISRKEIIEKLSVKIDNKILLIIVGLLIIGAFSFALLYPKFYIKNFNDKLIVIYGNELEDGNIVCYGNKIKCKEVKPIIEGEYDVSKVGEYQVNYVYKKNSTTLSKKEIIEVIDNEPPKLEIEENEYHYCPNLKQYDYKVTAIDNYDGDLTGQIQMEVKDNKLVYWVNDSSLNKGIIEVEATSKDTDKPEIKLNGSSVKYMIAGNKYIEEGATATDYCDGDLTDKITINGSVSNKAGKYILTYKVSDSSSNESSITRTIYVVNKNNSVTPGGKSIYLTFDDGPSSYTSGLLDILKKYDVKATFFVTNQGLTRGHDDVIKRAYDEGHTIGLHTYSHVYSNIYANIDNYFKDLDLIQNKVKNITGETSMIVRLPGGSSNTVSKNYDNGQRIMTKITNELENRGYKYFDWNIISGDAGGTTSTSKIISNVKSKLGNDSTYVVLQHDIKKYSVDAVESIILYGLSNNYTFRSLTMDSPIVHHSLNN